MVTGLAVIVVMPLMGKLSDTVSKFKIFTVATVVAVITINIYANFGATPFWLAAITSIIMMSAIMGRMAPSMALTSAVPDPQDRGAYMSVNSSLQQIAGGFGAVLASMIIVQKDNFAPLEHFDTLGIIASSCMVLTIYLVYRVSEIVKNKR
jgi:predicted MFS family arabinose efflux permease